MSVGEPLLLGGYLCGGSDGTDYLVSAWGLEQPCAGSGVGVGASHSLFSGHQLEEFHCHLDKEINNRCEKRTYGF